MQYTAESAENTQSLRFISVLNSLEGSEVGFEVTTKYLEGGQLQEFTWDPIKSDYVYSSITATSNGTVRTVTAKELGGTYVCALALDDVPTNIGQIDFYVKSYVIIKGEKVYSEQVRFTLNNGAEADLPALS